MLWEMWLEKKLNGLYCQICGYDHCFAALDFHHTDSTSKELSIAKCLSWAFNEKNKAKLMDQVKGCQILCSNCHRELHWREKNELN